MFTILLPVFLMLGASIAEVALNKTSQLAQVLHFIGDPIVALLIATIYSFFSLDMQKVSQKIKCYNLQMIALDLLQTYC